MAEFKLDRFKYRWRGNWQTATSYRKDDIVLVGGRSYVCLVAHTASSVFRDDLNAILPDSNPPQPQPRWVVMTAARTFKGSWSTTTVYEKGDLVLLNGSLYVCATAHTASTFESDESNWNIFALGIDYIGDWQASTEYTAGALAKYNGIVYKCITTHTGGATLENNIDEWTVFYEGNEFKGTWASSTNYRKNDIVRYGGNIFLCLLTHTSSGEFISDEYYQLLVPGLQFDGVWTDSTYYQEGDIVRFGGYVYIAAADNYAEEPSVFTDKWTLLYPGNSYKGDWAVSVEYYPGDVVLRGGNLYKALEFISGDGSSLDYTDESRWELLIPGKSYNSTWTTNADYEINDVVYFYGTAYVCNTAHTSSNDNYPGDNGNGIVFWDILIEAGDTGGMTALGDLLTYGLNQTVKGDGSTLGDTRVPIGNTGQFLSVSEDLEAYWRTVRNDSEKIYVSNNGDDTVNDGTFYFPFKTIRHACQYVEDTFDPLTPATVQVATGNYKEIGPISIPAGCVVMGDELRSTTIEATGPIDAYQNFKTLHYDGLDRFIQIIGDILTNTPITKSVGNTFDQSYSETASTVDVANDVVLLLDDYKDYIDFRIDSGSSDPTLSGSNTENADDNYLNGSIILDLNRNFIAQELYYFLVSENPDYTFTRNYVVEDYRELVRGLARDIKFSGNYLTLFAARRFVNGTNGSTTDDLFYARDTTGLRQASISGLTGGLNPPGVFDLYQRPTGGACVSLDPGWGPDDERVWIVNRSPYIQGITNIGDNCVGQKVDGSLHNGGNRSMTSNDFTQVLSDGIGAWITNNGRAELVSVFTYYCTVGYLAENGGIIRATNGNNSYGNFGSIADGFDANETPQSVTVNTRNNEAQVKDVFAGGTTDRIFQFQYTNCGEDYTTASAEIIGAGNNADVEYIDFRDGALFNARLINTSGSGSEGGAGYTTKGGNAQLTSGAQSRILLTASDTTQFLSEIENMRIIIVAGDGVGQYGYISGFDQASKEVTVRRESDGELGWDHIIPGTPIEGALDSTAQYRIEPRVSASAPPFATSNVSLGTNHVFVDAGSTGTTVDYVNISLPEGSGAVFETSRTSAVANINRSGPDYSVVLTNPGSGYAVGDILIVPGTDLGGAQPDNNLTITVTETTEDSTNSIVNFSISGTGRGSRIVAIGDGSTALYSDDGNTWTESTLPFSATMSKLIAAKNRFLAVFEDENRLAFSYTGEEWTSRSLPVTQSWQDGAYGNNTFVIIGTDTRQYVYSSDGLSWSNNNLPAGSDSTDDQWQSIAFGFGKFVVLSGSQTKDVLVSTNGISWTENDGVLPAGNYDWIAVEFGGDRFLALDRNGKTAYSFDGEVWYAGSSANDTGDTLVYIDLQFGQGVFAAIGSTGSTTSKIKTTEDGILWTERDLGATEDYSAITFQSLNNLPTFICFADNAISADIVKANIGKTAKLRADIQTGSFANVIIWDPGSGYTDSNPPVLTIYDDNATSDAETSQRLGNGVLAQPTFLNRGTGYRTSSTVVTVSGDGFADIIPESSTVVLSGVQTVPGPGVQIRFSTVEDPSTEDPDDLLLFSGVQITDLGDDGSGNGTKNVQFTLSPSLRNEYNIAHNTVVTLRENYSQCRITGHDFLDIGTGNFTETNYPDLYAGGAFFEAIPANEVLEANGGRVFYTSTDQDGNFRAGELFAVNQATGVVTISAEFFDLDGLTELALGGVRLGGSGTVVNEFSTDPTFAADSNSIIPTQRAVATFLATRLSVGGSELETNQLQAGSVIVGGVEDAISIAGDSYLEIGTDVVIDGQDSLGNPAGVGGTFISQILLTRTYNDTMQ